MWWFRKKVEFLWSDGAEARERAKARKGIADGGDGGGWTARVDADYEV